MRFYKLNHLSKTLSSVYINTFRTFTTKIMELKEVVKVFENFAPKKLAESWDNIGLLIEPSDLYVSKIMLTNDLTLKVLDEAIANKCNMILSYHPPIFKPLTKLNHNTWKEKVVIKCLENKIAVYSPHTAWDAVNGGVNDWLIKPFASEGKVKLLKEKEAPKPLVRLELASHLVEETASEGNLHWTPGPKDMLETICSVEKAKEIKDMIGDHESFVCHQVVTFQEKGVGLGKVVYLKQPITIKDAISRVKKHLGLEHLQLALACNATQDTKVASIAVFAGSGVSVIHDIKADLFISGELSHHAVLHCTNNTNGRPFSVILCNHSNAERGFLRVFEEYLKDKLSVEVFISKEDEDPLKVV